MLVAPRVQQGRTEQVAPVDTDPVRRSGAEVLLEEDELLLQRSAPPAVLDRPRDAEPAALRELTFPCQAQVPPGIVGRAADPGWRAKSPVRWSANQSRISARARPGWGCRRGSPGEGEVVRGPRVAGVREVGSRRDLVVGDASVPHLERDMHLHPGQVRAEAAVEAAGEADVRIRRAAEVDSSADRRTPSGSRFAACHEMPIFVPGGDVLAARELEIGEGDAPAIGHRRFVAHAALRSPTATTTDRRRDDAGHRDGAPGS